MEASNETPQAGQVRPKLCPQCGHDILAHERARTEAYRLYDGRRGHLLPAYKDKGRRMLCACETCWVEWNVAKAKGEVSEDRA